MATLKEIVDALIAETRNEIANALRDDRKAGTTVTTRFLVSAVGEFRLRVNNIEMRTSYRGGRAFAARGQYLSSTTDIVKPGDVFEWVALLDGAGDRAASAAVKEFLMAAYGTYDIARVEELCTVPTDVMVQVKAVTRRSGGVYTRAFFASAVRGFSADMAGAVRTKVALRTVIEKTKEIEAAFAAQTEIKTEETEAPKSPYTRDLDVD